MQEQKPLLDLIAAFSQTGWAQNDRLISQEDCEQLLIMAHDQKEAGFFRPAQIGSNQGRRLEKSIRSDEILWIDDWQLAPLSRIQLKLQALQLELKKCYFPCRRFESHLAHYASGSLYQRHKDQHQGNPHRLITAVLYLSPWETDCGGELMVYPHGQPEVKIEPHQGRFVIFESSFEHEVLATRCDRWSLTTWFRDDLSPGYAL